MRRAVADDAGAIAALTREAYAKWVDLIGREPLPMQVDYAEALTRDRFDVIERDGAIVGVIETAPDGDHLLIVNLATSPRLQGQGIAGELLACAEALAAEKGLRGLRLYTNKRFAENIRFYARRGFVVEREAPLADGSIVYMVKTLG